MRWGWTSTWGVVLCLGVGWTSPAGAQGQPTPPAATGDKGPLPLAAQGDQVLVKREATNLIDPEKYRVNLALEPIHTVVLTAPFDGIVKEIPEKLNNKVKPQTEILRLDNTVQRLQLQRAQAEFKLATLGQKGAKDEAEKEVATARVEAAKAELDLAQYRADQTSIRAPISGDIVRILVVPGEFVTAGQPLATIADSGRMKVEVPVERNLVKKGDPLTLKIEAAEVPGSVEGIMPLSSSFDPLRDLFESIASAVVVFDNANGKLFAGQTVYVPLIPRNPVVQVPSSAVLNGSDGTRRVQVLRGSVVRDLTITLMGPVGVDRLYVTGAFADKDEVIFQTSHQLPDGFQLQPLTAANAGGNTKPATPAGQPNRPAGAGF